MVAFDFEQVRVHLQASGLEAFVGSDNTLSLVPLLDSISRSDLLATWGVDEQDHLYCDLLQSEPGSAHPDLLAGIATAAPCVPGAEAAVAQLIADLMQAKILELARLHPAPSFALSAG